MKKLIISGITILSLIATGAFAHGERHYERAKNHENPPVSRHVDQVRTDNGFERKMTQTNEKGQTATRNTSIVNDKENKTRTRTETGTQYDGGTFSNQEVTQKTENGYTQDSTFTAQGKTTKRSVNAVVDRDVGNVTKHISVTDEKGAVTEKTVVQPLRHGKNHGKNQWKDHRKNQEKN